MKRIEFIRSSAIVCASVALPRYAWSNSGMYSFLGERRVAQILDAKESMVQNTPILRAFSGGKMDFVSPFVLLDEFGPMVVEPGTEGMQIKAHPHAGVTPTTYLLSGSGRHTDSLNNDIVYRKGQFMLFSSGSGAIHEEVSSDEIKRDGGSVHGFQIWLNIPSAEKFSTPQTAIHDHEDLPMIQRPGSRVKVIMGELFGQQSPTQTFSPAFYYHVHIEPNGRLDIPVDPAFNAFSYVIDGQVELEGQQQLKSQQIALFERGGDHVRFYSEKGCELLLLGGQPLNETVYSYGPFVMNNQEQIEQCFRNYREGRMGQL
ncbi:MAG: pirin family protein [Flavobacteriales bacterium]|nr:pirin family protein [Flavobacteriales bacterium]